MRQGLRNIFILGLLFLLLIMENGMERGNFKMALKSDTLVHLPQDVELSESMIAYDPPMAIDVEHYRELHPEAALIYTDEQQQDGRTKGMLLFEGPAADISQLLMNLNQKGDNSYLCCMPDNWMEQMGISLEPEEDLNHTYEFIREESDTCDLAGYCNPIGLCGLDGKERARTYGSLRALFGEPDYETEDLEDMFQYRLLVKRSDGREAVLLAYSGATGPSLSSRPEDHDMKEGAAFALKKLLRETSPADYSYEGYYWDGPSKVEMGSRNGSPYYKERELTRAEMEK